MKKRLLCVVLLLAVLLSGCLPEEQLVSYYGDQANFVTVSGTVSHIQYNEDETALHIGVVECPEGFSDTAFKLVGEGLAVAREKGIDAVLKLGDEMTFICAPRYFGDGYVVPIAAIAVDGEWLLEFDEGHAALMAWLEK